jgi:magnesium-dependent phosphatase 1
LNRAAYEQGLKAWQRSQKIKIPRNPVIPPKPRLIGYSGLPPSWIDLVRKGEGIVDRDLPYRWGYALYVASSLAL